METCTCDHVLCQGPGLLAAGFHYRHQLRTTEQPGVKKRRRSANADDILRLVMRLVTKLEGDAPVRYDYAEEASELEMSEETLRARIAWLAEHRYVALDGQVDGLARIWVNPAVAFSAGKTDPRVAAARHQFPYILTDEKGMAAEQPVHVLEYDEEGWESVYRNNAEQFEDPPRFPAGCPLHGQMEATQ